MDILDGIIIGSVGGALAGITTLLFQWIKNGIYISRDKKRVYKWLNEVHMKDKNYEYRSTRTIASWTNLTEDRVRYICSIHKKIHLSVGEKEDSWKLKNNS